MILYLFGRRMRWMLKNAYVQEFRHHHHERARRSFISFIPSEPPSAFFCGLREFSPPLDVQREGTDKMTLLGDESFLDSPEFTDLNSDNRALLTYAFDHAGDPSPATDKPARKKRKTESIEPEGTVVMPEVETGGGFLPEDDYEGGGFVVDDGEEGGGFLVDEGKNEEGGGFFMDDEAQDGGGFLPDLDIEEAESNQPDISTPSLTDESSSRPIKTHIPLSLIPRALKLAKLPPSDPEVLEFFKQSAEGWSDETDPNTARLAERRGGGGGGRKRVCQEKGVSRRDWFSVCAILFASRANGDINSAELKDRQDEEEEEEEDGDEDVEDDEWMEDDPEQGGGFVASYESRPIGQGEDEDDIFNPNRRRTRRTTRSVAAASPVPSLSSSDGDEDDDEAAYSESGVFDKKITKPSRSAKSVGKTKGRKTKRALCDEDITGDINLTKGEMEKAKEAWSLFFTNDRKNSNVIGFKEVWEAARVLKEGWNEAQVREMIASFSSAPDKSVLSLEDFGKLMWQGGMLA